MWQEYVVLVVLPRFLDCEPGRRDRGHVKPTAPASYVVDQPEHQSAQKKREQEEGQNDDDGQHGGGEVQIEGLGDANASGEEDE